MFSQQQFNQFNHLKQIIRKWHADQLYVLSRLNTFLGHVVKYRKNKKYVFILGQKGKHSILEMFGTHIKHSQEGKQEKMSRKIQSKQIYSIRAQELM